MSRNRLLVEMGVGEPRAFEVPNFRHLIYLFKSGTEIALAVDAKVNLPRGPFTAPCFEA